MINKTKKKFKNGKNQKGGKKNSRGKQNSRGKNNNCRIKYTKKKIRGGSYYGDKLTTQESENFAEILDRVDEHFKSLPQNKLYDKNNKLITHALTYKLKFLNNLLSQDKGYISFITEEQEIASILVGMENYPQEDMDLVKKGILFFKQFVIKEDLQQPGATGFTKTKEMFDKLKEIKEVYSLPALCSYKYITYYDQQKSRHRYFTLMLKGNEDMNNYFFSGKTITMKETLDFCLKLVDTIHNLAENGYYYTDLKLDNIAIYTDNNTNENELFLIDLDSIVGSDTFGQMTYNSYVLHRNLILLNHIERNMVNTLYGLCVTIFMLVYMAREIATDYKTQARELDLLIFDNTSKTINEDNQFQKYMNTGIFVGKAKPVRGVFILNSPLLKKLDIIKHTLHGFDDGDDGIITCLLPFFDGNNIITPENKNGLKTALGLEADWLVNKLKGLRRCILQDYQELNPSLGSELMSLFA